MKLISISLNFIVTKTRFIKNKDTEDEVKCFKTITCDGQKYFFNNNDNTDENRPFRSKPNMGNENVQRDLVEQS